MAFVKLSPHCLSPETVAAKVRVFHIGTGGVASSLQGALTGLYCPLLLEATDLGGLPQPTGNLLSELETSLRSAVRDATLRV